MPILQDAMTPPEAAPAAAPQGDLPPPNPAVTSPLIKTHSDELSNMVRVMTPTQKEAYARVLKAGMTMLYSPETRGAMNEIILDDTIPVANKLGEGVANLVVMMDNEGNGTIPKDILIPVGVSLLFELADYLFEVDIEVTEEDLSNGLEMMVYGIYLGYGFEAEQVDKMIGDVEKQLDLKPGNVDAAKSALKDREEGQMEAAEAETPEEDAAEGPAGEEAEFDAGFAAEQQKRSM